MKHSLLLFPLSLVAVATLSACGNSEETVNDTIGDPMENQLAHAAPVALPPMLKASKTYRCKDNSLVYIDFFADDVSANIRTEKDGKATKLSAPEKGKALTADGYSVEGSGQTVNVALPGKGSQSCKA
jgi:hypothetical protein